MDIGNKLVAIPTEALDEYTGYFLRNVGTPSKRYGVLDQPKRYNEDAKALEALLLAIPKDHFLKPPLNDSTYMEFELNGHGQTFSNALMELTGITGSMLTIEGEDCGEDTAVNQNEDVDYHALVLCSHLPRAMQHAILKYYPNMKGADIFSRAQASITEGKGDIREDIYRELIKETLDHGIIPTPLLGAQYFGRLEGYIERLEGPDDGSDAWKNLHDANERIRAEKRKELFRNGFSQEDVEKVINEMDELSKLRKYPSFQIHTEEGDREHVPYVTFYMDTVNELMPLFVPGGKLYGMFSKINCITHSGDFDLFKSWMRNYGKNDFHITRTKTPAERGQVAVLKVSHGFRQPVYLNDPAPLVELMKKTEANIRDFRALSHDEKIRQGDGVVEAGLCEFTKEGGMREEGRTRKEEVSFDELLAAEEPSLILGNCGMGKTTLCLYLAETLKARYEKERYVPLLIRLRRASEDISRVPQGLKESSSMRRELSLGLLDMPVQALMSYKKDGYKFVFILDGYDEFCHNYDKNLKSAVEAMSEYGKVIMTSRVEGFGTNKDDNKGYLTLNIDPEAIVGNLEKYVTARIGRGTDKLVKFFEDQSDDIRKNWLVVSLLTQMYKDGSYDIDFTGKVDFYDVVHEGKNMFVWEHLLERKPEMLRIPTMEGFASRTEYEAEVVRIKREARESVLKQCMPLIDLINTYMVVNGEPMVDYDTVMKIEEGRWNLITENEFRSGRRASRFLEDHEMHPCRR